MQDDHDRRRSMSAYSSETELDVRYRDVDAVGHVNNAVYVTYLEQARTQYVEGVLEESTVDLDVAIASLNIDYERPIFFGETVTVRLRVSDLGTSSIIMEYEILADGARAATAETVMVPFDADTGSSRPIPELWRERIEADEGRTF